MFYQILLFMPLKTVVGWISFTAFFSFYSEKFTKGSGKWTCLFEDPTWSGQAGRHKQIHQKSPPSTPLSSQINGGGMTGPRAWQQFGNGSGWWMETSTPPHARPPLLPPSFVFVSVCFLLHCHGPAVCKSHRQCQRLFLRKTQSCRMSSDFGPEIRDVCSLSLPENHSILKLLNH